MNGGDVDGGGANAAALPSHADRMPMNGALRHGRA